MSTVFFISDHHFGHKAILKFSPSRGGTTVEEHNEWLVEQHNSVVKKNSLVYMLGDVAFGVKHLHYLKRMKGQKVLIRGNHDEGHTKAYEPYFNNVFGLYKRYGLWLSHAPIHHHELRGIPNVHGHVHMNTIQDERYYNVCVENLNGVPISLEELRIELKKTPRL